MLGYNVPIQQWYYDDKMPTSSNLNPLIWTLNSVGIYKLSSISLLSKNMGVHIRLSISVFSVFFMIARTVFVDHLCHAVCNLLFNRTIFAGKTLSTGIPDIQWLDMEL